MKEEEGDYQKIKGFVRSSYVTITISVIQPRMKIGPRKQTQLQIFKNNIEILTRTRWDPKVILAWYGISSKQLN